MLSKNCSEIQSRYGHGTSNTNHSIEGPLAPAVYVQTDPPLPCGGSISFWKMCYSRSSMAESYDIDLIILRNKTALLDTAQNFTVVGFNRITLNTTAEDTDSRECVQIPTSINFEDGDFLAFSVLRLLNTNDILPIAYTTGGYSAIGKCKPANDEYYDATTPTFVGPLRIFGNLTNVSEIRCSRYSNILEDQLDLQVVVDPPTPDPGDMTVTPSVNHPAQTSTNVILIVAIVVGVVLCILVIVIFIIIITICCSRRQVKKLYALEKKDKKKGTVVIEELDRNGSETSCTITLNQIVLVTHDIFVKVMCLSGNK